MVSITLLVSAVLALATSQVTAAPQVLGGPEAVAQFYSNCADLSQTGIPTQDQILEPTDSTCYSFTFHGVVQTFTASGFQGTYFNIWTQFHDAMLTFSLNLALVWSGTGCTGTSTAIPVSAAINNCKIITGASYQVVPVAA